MIKRVYRSFQNLVDSDSDVSEDEDLPSDLCSGMTNFQTLENCSEWASVSHDNLPGITDKDIENYYMF